MLDTDHTDTHITPPMLAKRWHCSEQALAQNRYLKQGVPFIHIGRRVLYRIADVEAFEAANRTDPAAVAI